MKIGKTPKFALFSFAHLDIYVLGKYFIIIKIQQLVITGQ
ncbi:uncharacterized protein METZ01_LOCUS22287 [marine metagenome]|jgi:hypothetical protein|uniref:Uncharacterized protein n=1 Tax=marine metagenome TaxID=408172 RepID=A0A381PVI2_9ZZZZ